MQDNQIDVLDLLDSSNFITLNKSLIQSLGLNEAIMLGELAGKYRYWKTAGRLDKNGYFFIKRDDLNLETGLSSHQQRKALEHLKDLGIVDYGQDEHSTNRSNLYKIFNDALLNYLTMDGQKIERSNVEKLHTTNTSYTNTSDTKTSIKYSVEQIIEIVDYLNLKANKNYRNNSKDTMKFVQARLNEGFTVDDFKKVIDNKCAEWLADNKMNQYLRPGTLFGTKFESYLNQKITSKSDGMHFNKNNNTEPKTEVIVI